MRESSLIFNSKRNNGGYGDRLVGMSAVCTIARVLGSSFRSVWEARFARLCDSLASELPAAFEEIDNINRNSSELLSGANLRSLWQGKTIVMQANQPIDRLLWGNPFLQEELNGRSYESESIRSYKEIFSKHIRLRNVPEEKFICGIQVRCGDGYCAPYELAEKYIAESEFEAHCQTLKAYLQQRKIAGRVYVTSDARRIYECFESLNDSNYEFVFWDRSGDVHFDHPNSADRAFEIVRDHSTLQNCQMVITSLRSNFGTTAAYCSPHCKELVLHSPPDCFEEYDCSSQLVLKEYIPRKHKSRLQADS